MMRNPEIQALAPVLIGAIADPSGQTKTALEALTATSFVHSVDPPSLALVIPILQRGLASRSTSVKKTAGVIAGNVCRWVFTQQLRCPSSHHHHHRHHPYSEPRTRRHQPAPLQPLVLAAHTPLCVWQ